MAGSAGSRRRKPRRRAGPGRPRAGPGREAARGSGAYEKGIAKVFDRDALGALDYFEGMIRDDPLDPAGYSGAGFILASGGNAPGALEHFRKALKLGDDRAETRLHMGNACRMLDMHGEALECYRAALDRRPDLAPAHFGMAYTHAIRGDYREAAKSADEVLRHHGLLDEAGTIKGIALLNAGRREEALGLLAGAERADEAEVYHNMGAVYDMAGMKKEARECRRRAGSVAR